MKKSIIFQPVSKVVIVISLGLLFNLTSYAQRSVSWSHKKNVTIKNGYISKFEGGILWNAGASSKQILSKNNDGWLQATIEKVKQTKVIGLIKPGKDEDWERLAYGFFITSKGLINIVESFQVVAKTGRKCQKGDIIKIQKTGSSISYQLNNEVLHTSSRPVATALQVKVGFYASGVGFSRVKVSTNFSALPNNNRKQVATALKPGKLSMSTGLGAFGQTIFLDAFNLTTLNAIKSLENKESYYLYINNDNMTQREFGTSCQYMPWIKKLVIHRADQVQHYDAIKVLTNLEEVYFLNATPQQSAIDLQILAQAKTLKRLTAYNFTKFSNYELLKSLPALEKLELVNASIEDLEFLKGFKKLRELDISGYQNTFNDLTPIASLERLEKLDISGNEKINDLIPLQKCVNLKELTITRSNRPFPDSEIEKLKKLFPGLKISKRISH